MRFLSRVVLGGAAALVAYALIGRFFGTQVLDDPLALGLLLAFMFVVGMFANHLMDLFRKR